MKRTFPLFSCLLSLVLLVALIPFAFAASCQVPGSGGDGEVAVPGDTPSMALSWLTALGDAAIRTDGTVALQKYAPEALELLDVAPRDGIVTLAELASFTNAASDPAQLTWLLIMAREVYRARSGK
jgi:hypothetical protein